MNQSTTQNLYSAPSRSPLRGAPDPGQAEKNSLEKVVESRKGSIWEVAYICWTWMPIIVIVDCIKETHSHAKNIKMTLSSTVCTEHCMFKVLCLVHVCHLNTCLIWWKTAAYFTTKCKWHNTHSHAQQWWSISINVYIQLKNKQGQIMWGVVAQW